MKFELLSPDAPAWRSLLSRVPHDFYHLPAYVRACARLDGGDPSALFVVDGARSLLVPLLIRPVDGPGMGPLDAISPYGYPGPLVDAPDADRDTFSGDALAASLPFLRERGVLSLFIRLHPVLGPVPDMASATIVSHGHTVVIELTKSEDELWRETMSGHRNEINRALRAGHRAYVDNEFTHIDRFITIYHETMARVGASKSYFFDRDYVTALREALGTRLKLVVVDIDGSVGGAGLFVETGGIVQYHLSGTDERFIAQRPTKLMLHFVRSWAKARGNRFLHLGGGVGGQNDSLFRFKAGFSSLRLPFHTLRIVVDQYGYMARTRAKHPDSDPNDHSDFFPAYRRP